MATKRYSELRAADWQARVFLLEGEEPVLRREFLMRVRTTLNLSPGSMDEATLDARETPVSAVGSVLLTAPMEAERRLVILQAVNRYNANELQNLARLVEQVPPFACLVLIPLATEESDGSKAGWNALTRAVDKHGVVVQFKPLTGDALTRRLVEHARAAGKRLRPEDAEYLQTLVDGVAELALAELDKLILYVEPRDTISRLDIDMTVSPSQQAQVFKLVDAVVARDAPTAMRLLRRSFQSGTRTEETARKTLGLIARQYRLLWGVKLLLQYHQPIDQPSKISAEVAQKLPKDPDVVQVLTQRAFLRDALRRQAEQLSFAQLCEAFEALADADLALKGLRPSVNDAEIMERLIVRLTLGDSAAAPSPQRQGG